MSQSIIHVVWNQCQAESIIQHLIEAGFPGSRVSVRLDDPKETAQLASRHRIRMLRRIAPPLCLLGVTSGGVTGGLLAWASGTDMVGLGAILPVVVTAPLATLLAGTAIGALIGAGAAAWISSEFDRGTYEFYERKLKDGRALVCVDVDNEVDAKRATDIIRLIEIRERVPNSQSEHVMRSPIETPLRRGQGRSDWAMTPSHSTSTVGRQ